MTDSVNNNTSQLETGQGPKSQHEEYAVPEVTMSDADNIESSPPLETQDPSSSSGFVAYNPGSDRKYGGQWFCEGKLVNPWKIAESDGRT